MLFERVAQALEDVERESSRIVMAERLAQLFKEGKDNIKHLVYFLDGVLAPPFYGVEIGLGERLVIEALAETFGFSTRDVERYYVKYGDLGSAAQVLAERRRQSVLFSSPLTFEHVFSTFLSIAHRKGEGSIKVKKKLLAELLNNASPLEVKYVVRFALGELRLGVGYSTVIEALAVAFLADRALAHEIERAFNRCADLGFVAEVVGNKGLEGVRKVDVSPLVPLRPALAERLPSEVEIFKRLGVCAVEYKFDGFRMQIHKRGTDVKIFSRKLEDITYMFPDVESTVRRMPVDEIVFEGEALAFNVQTNTFFSFQETIRRRRKYGIEEMEKKYPLHVYVFDVLFFKHSLIDEPYSSRRKVLEQLFPFERLRVSPMFLAHSAQDIRTVFEEAINKGLEGIMVKDLHAPYTAGARKFAWIKMKKSYGKSVDTVDAVIVGYYYGKGQRAHSLGGLLVAVRQGQQLVTVAKVGSGFSEDEMKELLFKLEGVRVLAKPREVQSHLTPDVWVKPVYVVEVAFDEITQSPVHTCCWKNGKGLALRFPRFVQLREDKGVDECTTAQEIYDMFTLKSGK